MATATENLFGIGIYTPEEAGFYARVQTRLVNRWIFGNKQGPSVVAHQLEHKEKIVTFLDFVQMLAIRELRVKHKIPLQTIRDAVKEFHNEYGINYPFARQHVAYIFKRGKDDKSGGLYIGQPGDDGDRIYTKIAGTKKGQAVSRGQMALTKLVEFYMRDLHFNPDGLAEFYEAYCRPYNGNTKRVVLHPGRRFGEPLVESCGITPQTLYEASLTEGSIEAAAYIYEVDQGDVDIACRYIDYLTPPTDEKVAA